MVQNMVYPDKCSVCMWRECASCSDLMVSVVVQLLSHVQLFVTSWTAALQDSLSISISQSLLKLMSVETVMPSNHLLLYCPFSSWLHSFPASGSFPMSQFFVSGGQNIGASASASVLPSEYSGLISFRVDWFDLLAVQGMLKSLLQHHSSKASVLQRSAFFTVQVSHPWTWPLEKS